MASRPLIGLPAQTLEAIPGQVPRAWAIGQQYVRALTAAGALPWPLPLLPEDEATLRAIYDRLDGVFLAGGADVDPCHYDEARASCCGEVDPPRDRTELLLARWAVAEGKPLFGVCRGFQLINVACGGSLYQDLPSQCAGPLRHDHFSKDMVHDRDRRTHHVRIETDTLLARLLGRPEVEVNSMHHQGVRQLAPGLRATALAPDGLVEGFEGPGPFLLGVQWHPEELVETDEASRRLFAGFVEASPGNKSAMIREYHHWLSPALDRDMELLVFGHGGARVLAFPGDRGRFHDWEDRGLVSALADDLESGTLQLFCVDSIDGESWYATSQPVAERLRRHVAYDRYLYEELVPFSLRRNETPLLIVTGPGLGGYHALNFTFRHPESVRRVLSLSGAVDVRPLFGDYYDDECYLNNPCDFLAGEHDAARLEALRRLDIIMAVGRDDPLCAANERLSLILWGKNVWHALRIWEGLADDWPVWARMLQLYIGGHD